MAAVSLSTEKRGFARGDGDRRKPGGAVAKPAFAEKAKSEQPDWLQKVKNVVDS